MAGFEDAKVSPDRDSNSPHSRIPRKRSREPGHDGEKGREADLKISSPSSSTPRRSEGTIAESPSQDDKKNKAKRVTKSGALTPSNSFSKIPRAPQAATPAGSELPKSGPSCIPVDPSLTGPSPSTGRLTTCFETQDHNTIMDGSGQNQEVRQEVQPEPRPEVNLSHTATPSQSSDATLADEKTSGFTYADAVKENAGTMLSEVDDQMGDIHQHEPPADHEKIRWAPLNVPLKRRLQTLVVLIHSMGIATTVSIFFALCAIPLFWPFLIIYLIQVLSSNAAIDGSLRYRSERFRKSYIWRLFAGYFPAKLHKTHELSPSRKYILGYHPHGIISHGGWAAFASDALGFSEKFPGITNSLLTLDSNFRIPLYRDYIMAMGLRSVSKESITNILTKGGPNNKGMGRAVTIVIGGARESLAARPGKMRLVLKDRKGFIKIAIRTGADLVPVLAFGENDLYDQLPPEEHPRVRKFQMFVLKVWKFTLPFMYGRGIFNYDVGLMPYRRPLNVVIGAPIEVMQSDQPDIDEIDRLHELYVAELEELWDRYKDKFAPNRTEEMQIQ